MKFTVRLRNPRRAVVSKRKGIRCIKSVMTDPRWSRHKYKRNGRRRGPFGTGKRPRLIKINSFQTDFDIGCWMYLCYAIMKNYTWALEFYTAITSNDKEEMYYNQYKCFRKLP